MWRRISSCWADAARFAQQGLEILYHFHRGQVTISFIEFTCVLFLLSIGNYSTDEMEAEDREESPKPVGKTKERRAVRTERWESTQNLSNYFSKVSPIQTICLFRQNFVNKGKLQRDRRKLREKRRSTGVVHLQSTEVINFISTAYGFLCFLNTQFVFICSQLAVVRVRMTGSNPRPGMRPRKTQSLMKAAV